MPEPDAALALPPVLGSIRDAVDKTLFAFLAEERASIAADHDAFLPLFDELERMVRAGGKRLRPMFCWLGFRAGGGAGEHEIARVAGAIELFHTFALIHDDVMDDGAERRGAPTIHVRMAQQRAADPDAERFGLSSAILAGDFAMVLADHLFLHSGFPPERLAAAFRRYNRMRVEVAVGQFLDIEGSGRAVEEREARRISSLKSGSYTVEGPLHVGAILAGAPIEVLSALSRYGTPLGEAFQVRDDLEGALRGDPDLAQARPTVLLAKARELAGPEDRAFLDGRLGRGSLTSNDAHRVLEVLRSSGALDATISLVDELIEEAVEALRGDLLPPDVAEGLGALAQLLAVEPR
jgi:geranylgeranyl diphosphate synthase type I